ncbi:MAG TPA: protein translocase subunit SecF [Clostridiales bacterium]|nr:protein translocase subunit SecF [Clostridiales bacterium]
MIDLMGKKKIFFAISIFVILAGVVGLIVNGGLNYDIQFQGGTIIQVEMSDDNFDANNIGSVVSDMLNKKVSSQKLKTYNPKNEAESINILMLKVPSDHTLSDTEINNIVDLLRKDYNVNPEAEIQMQSVQPSIAAEIKQKGITAILVSSALIIVYIWWRFSNISGLPAAITAVIALMHDALVMLSAYAIFKIPLNESFIAAVLTILGYSLNDTIIIYDRIRENSGKLRKLPVNELVNTSITQTMGRTINTSVTTLIAIVIVYIFASANNIQSIKEFSFPLIIGIISGTYSSIFIASPLWMMWKERQSKAKIVAKQAKART